MAAPGQGTRRLRVVILTTDQPNQRALVHRVAATTTLAGVVTSRNRPNAVPPHPSPLPRRLTRSVLDTPFRTSWLGMQRRYAELYPRFPDAPLCEVEEVNDARTVEVVGEAAADLVLVSGTNLLRQPLIDASNARTTFGTMNLHTGLSPYVRGGPNCTNWCLATSRPWLIGNTVMWIDAGIDSGAIVATECTSLDGTESLGELHRKVMDHAHDLTVRAVGAVGAGATAPVPQADFREKGSLHLTRHWTGGQMAKAWLFHRASFGRAVRSPSFEHERADLELVRLTPAAG